MAVTPAQCCDGELLVWQLLFALSHTMRQMEAACHSPSSILQESETDSNLVKAECDAFSVLSACSIWKARISVLSEHHWQENEKREKSWYISSYKWSKCWSSHIFIFCAQLKVSGQLCTQLFSREKRRKGNIHWSKEIPNPSFFFSLFSSATPSHPSQLLNAFCWKS